jgi:hypothetical protein
MGDLRVPPAGCDPDEFYKEEIAKYRGGKPLSDVQRALVQAGFPVDWETTVREAREGAVTTRFAPLRKWRRK